MGKPKRSRRKSHRAVHVFKPNGILHARVQKVGPEHFGIVAVDCAKHRSEWMLADFYGKMLAPPAKVEHTAAELQAAVDAIRHACDEHQLHDMICAIERTGDYHLPVQRAFRDAGFETRIVHPFATKQHRQTTDPGNKTDPNDEAAIVRAAISGLGLIEQPLDPLARQLRLLERQRRDLVRKRSTLQCQMRQHLHLLLPGFAELFKEFFMRGGARYLARRLEAPQAFRQLGVHGMTQMLDDAGIAYHRATLAKIAAWAPNAAPADPDGQIRLRIYQALDDDWNAKTTQIVGLERDLASRLVQTPYLVLLSIPGINVVSCAEFAGEMGPIAHYANHRAITGRAGLFPSRYQSDKVDRKDGPLVRCANRRLRYAILAIADNLATCNDHFKALASNWKAAGKGPRHNRIKIASRFCRIAFTMVAGESLFHHPAAQRRDKILQKLIEFYREHDTDMSQQMIDLKTAADRIPKYDRVSEAEPLNEQLAKLRKRRRGPQLLGDVLPEVLAKLIGEHVELKPAGD